MEKIESPIQLDSSHRRRRYNALFINNQHLRAASRPRVRKEKQSIITLTCRRRRRDENASPIETKVIVTLTFGDTWKTIAETCFLSAGTAF